MAKMKAHVSLQRRLVAAAPEQRLLHANHVANRAAKAGA